MRLSNFGGSSSKHRGSMSTAHARLLGKSKVVDDAEDSEDDANELIKTFSKGKGKEKAEAGTEGFDYLPAKFRPSTLRPGAPPSTNLSSPEISMNFDESSIKQVLASVQAREVANTPTRARAAQASARQLQSPLHHANQLLTSQKLSSTICRVKTPEIPIANDRGAEPDFAVVPLEEGNNKTLDASSHTVPSPLDLTDDTSIQPIPRIDPQLSVTITDEEFASRKLKPLPSRKGGIILPPSSQHLVEEEYSEVDLAIENLLDLIEEVQGCEQNQTIQWDNKKTQQEIDDEIKRSIEDAKAIASSLSFLPAAVGATGPPILIPQPVQHCVLEANPYDEDQLSDYGSQAWYEADRRAQERHAALFRNSTVSCAQTEDGASSLPVEASKEDQTFSIDRHDVQQPESMRAAEGIANPELQGGVARLSALYRLQDDSDLGGEGLINEEVLPVSAEEAKSEETEGEEDSSVQSSDEEGEMVEVYTGACSHEVASEEIPQVSVQCSQGPPPKITIQAAKAKDVSHDARPDIPAFVALPISVPDASSHVPQPSPSPSTMIEDLHMQGSLQASIDEYVPQPQTNSTPIPPQVVPVPQSPAGFTSSPFWGPTTFADSPVALTHRPESFPLEDIDDEISCRSLSNHSLQDMDFDIPIDDMGGGHVQNTNTPVTQGPSTLDLLGTASVNGTPFSLSGVHLATSLPPSPFPLTPALVVGYIDGQITFRQYSSPILRVHSGEPWTSGSPSKYSTQFTKHISCCRELPEVDDDDETSKTGSFGSFTRSPSRKNSDQTMSDIVPDTSFEELCEGLKLLTVQDVPDKALHTRIPPPAIPHNKQSSPSTLTEVYEVITVVENTAEDFIPFKLPTDPVSDDEEEEGEGDGEREEGQIEEQDGGNQSGVDSGDTVHLNMSDPTDGAAGSPSPTFFFYRMPYNSFKRYELPISTQFIDHCPPKLGPNSPVGQPPRTPHIVSRRTSDVSISVKSRWASRKDSQDWFSIGRESTNQYHHQSNPFSDTLSMDVLFECLLPANAMSVASSSFAKVSSFMGFSLAPLKICAWAALVMATARLVF